ncbi:MAG TPA: hypothetical protein VGG61_04005 [Gemmataceae bacterium]|jgi:hypothetical protein
MSTHSLDDLRGFHDFVGEKVSNGGASLSPEEVLAEWRILHPDPEAVEEDLAAIQEAIEDMENGDTGIPFEEFDRDFRARRHLPPKS